MNMVTTPSATRSLTNWSEIDWRKIEQYVKKLRQRIFCAQQLGQHRRVRKLQRLMLQSKANLLLSIRRVTQINKGKRTAGVDGIRVLSPKERLNLYNQMRKQYVDLHHAKPAKRIYIPKKKTKLRPLGIPIIKDRIWQNVVRSALEPQWEVNFESITYGFRPKRSTHDAIQNIFIKLNQGRKKWIFEGDYKGCFDNLSHDFILNKLKMFPAKIIIQRWLTAGYLDKHVFHNTEKGTPQGGIISPLLANIALHGIEEEIGIKYRKIIDPKTEKIAYKIDRHRSRYSVVAYADDFVIMCETKDEARNMHQRLRSYVEKRGLELSPEKTKITQLTSGFDFLGFNIRWYQCQKPKLLIKPSKESIKKAKEKIKEIFKKHHGHPVKELIQTLNPIIRGYANYWKHVVSKKIFGSMDHYITKKVIKFLKRLHPRKSMKWIIKRYFHFPRQGGGDKWILTCPVSEIQLLRMSWTKIQRHVLIQYKNSPDDPTLEKYFEQRDKKEFDGNNTMSRIKLAKRQDYKCPKCKQSLQNGEALEIHHIVPRSMGGKDEYKNLQLLHTPCHIQHHSVSPKLLRKKNA
jgi:RNA-directed DNA polymerase